MLTSRLSVLALLVVLAMSACAPAAPAGGASPDGRTSATPAGPSRTLVLLSRVEPGAATPRVDQSAGVAMDLSSRLFTTALAYLDEREVPRPYLAETLPELNKDSWRVFPDGRMETTYVLRPNLVWHDGAPLTAHDFVFALKLYNDPETNSIFERIPQRDMDDIVATDDRTIVMRWKRPNPDAGALGGSKTGYHALPRHLLESVYLSDPASIVNSTYWTRDHIGAGPYKLERWETGSFIEGSAFDRHALGRPKIDKVRLIWISDPNAALANLMAGSADLAADAALDFQQALILKREWGPQNRGNVILNTREVRYVQIQARPDIASPRSILDVRTRRALAHGIDRQSLIDGMLEGEGIIADTIVSPDLDYYPALDRVLAKYPYDPRKTEQLLNEVGYTRGGDGFFANAAGERLAPETRGPIANELQILIDGWKRAGVDAQLSVTPAALATNNEYRSFFPAFAITKSSLPERTAVRKYATSDVASAENRYGGTNKDGYSHPEYDRLLDGFNGALAREERSNFVMGIMKLASEEVPSFPLYYDLTVTAHVGSLQGPIKSAPDGLNYANIHEWAWR